MENLRGSLGFKGERGYSAYEIAVQEGYEGTEEEWINHFGLDLTNYIQKSDVIDNVTSDTTDKPLSAKQGKLLNTNIGDLTNLDTGVKTDIVSAINELNTALGSVPSFYSGTTEPDSSLGENGDIYFKYTE